jgi:exodeoxyribonuclease III
MKIYSFNVNGIRAWERKGMYDWFIKTSPDILCFQETKARKEQLSQTLQEPEGYHSYFESSKVKKGYSGTAIYTKEKPKEVIYGLGKKALDLEGRQIALVFKNFVLINCYFPNGGGGDERLKYKLKYFDEFLKFIKKLEKKHTSTPLGAGKNIIFCGDVNIAHNEIDLARPKENSKYTGFLPVERAVLDKYINEGFKDVFRELHPRKVKYSWWDMKSRARDRNVGWRIDYFFVTKNLLKKVKKAEIHNDVYGSDHCPISLTVEL